MMCGIFGIWHIDGKPVDLRAPQKATGVLRHRGPDDEGYLLVNTQKRLPVSCGGKDTHPDLSLRPLEDFLENSFDLAFGFRRLSILDLSPTGHQPMSNEDGMVWVVLNGEIYNYLELRQDLKDKGHVFRSHADTETLIHGYEEYGERVLDYLNGMFAFALWDGRNGRLFCARDRLGIKPFYYYRDQGTFLFSSEIKAILAIRSDLRTPNYSYLKDFIRSGQLDRDRFTLFDQIYSLQPAHFLLISTNSSCLQRYWDFEESQAISRYDYLHPKETLRFLLRDAIRLQLRSDVPIGTCLSGGLDSTSVVALASSMLTHPMSSFSSVYKDAGYDEGQFVETAASAFHTDSHIVQPTPADFLSTLRNIAWHMDEPTAGPGIYSQWFVMKEAHGKVKVLLDGQGGDELLGGYHRYFYHYMASLWHRLCICKDPRYLIRMGSDIFGIWRIVGHNFRFLGFQPFVRKLLMQVGVNLGKPIADPIFRPEFEKDLPPLALEPRITPRLSDPLNNRLYWDTVRDSIPALLHYEDRNSMAFGIEARVPLLDHRIVEFCLGLPPELKIHRSKTKVLLREAMADILPPKIVNRRDKKGYPTPMAIWLRDGLYQEIRDFLLSPRVKERGIFDISSLGRLLEEHRSGQRDLSWDIWRWITCELWFRIFLD